MRHYTYTNISILYCDTIKFYYYALCVTLLLCCFQKLCFFNTFTLSFEISFATHVQHYSIMYIGATNDWSQAEETRSQEELWQTGKGRTNSSNPSNSLCVLLLSLLLSFGIWFPGVIAVCGKSPTDQEFLAHIEFIVIPV